MLWSSASTGFSTSGFLMRLPFTSTYSSCSMTTWSVRKGSPGVVRARQQQERQLGWVTFGAQVVGHGLGSQIHAWGP